MSGELDPTAFDVIVLAGKPVQLKPPVGLKAIKMMPKVLSVGSEIIYTAIEAGIPVDRMFINNEFDRVPSTAVVKAIKFISDRLIDRIDELAADVLPLLLCSTYAEIDKATPYEILAALWKAIQFHIPHFVGSNAVDALKKSLVVAEESADTTTA